MIPTGTPKAKANFWHTLTLSTRKCEEQNGLETHVVHTLNDAHSSCSESLPAWSHGGRATLGRRDAVELTR